MFKNQFKDFLVILAISIINNVGTAVLPCSYALITECVVFNFDANFWVDGNSIEFIVQDYFF